MKTRLACTLVLALILAATAAASDATTGQLVMAANAAAVRDGGQQSITSLFNTKFASGLAQGQTVSLSLLEGASFGETLAGNTFLSIFTTPGGVVPLDPGEFRVWDTSFEPAGEGQEPCPESTPNCVAPQQLEGVRVRVDGEPGFVSAVVAGEESDQINFIAPDIEGIGAGILVELEGPNASGMTMVDFSDIAPAFFPFEPEGRRFLAAVQNTPDPGTPCTFVGREDLFGGAPLPNGCSIRPARPGDIIQLFATGFGETDPQVPAGRIPTEIAELVDSVDVRLGGQSTTVFFAGLAVGLAGVYQIVIEIPELPNDDHELIADIAGRQTQSGAFITVQREM